MTGREESEAALDPKCKRGGLHNAVCGGLWKD